jgi:hypothetical protein
MQQHPTTSPTAAAFYTAWLNAVNAEDLPEKFIDLFPTSTELTSLVIHRHNGIIVRVANELGLKAWNGDYYDIDAVLYSDEKDEEGEAQDKVHGCPDNLTYLHHIRVAFEHENAFNDNLYQEIAHLLITNCDLRVLVTYPNTELTEWLPWFHKMIRRHPQQADFAEQENFLLLFGYREGPRWEARVYKTEDWKLLS